MIECSDSSVPFGQINQPLTLLGKALRRELEATGQPVITTYALFQMIRGLYRSGQKLRLRSSLPSRDDLNRLRRQLADHHVLIQDTDFGKGVYRIVANNDRPAEEICGIVDPFCHISHLSAMARLGLTDRRPAALHLTSLDLKTSKERWMEVFHRDYPEEERNNLDDHFMVQPTTRTHFPPKVRGHSIVLKRTAHPGGHQPLRGSFGRIATVGQVFVDTLEDPDACGGMGHVMEVWQEHAEMYLNDIIAAVEGCSRGITKVRAGYLLDEYLQIKNPRIDNWTRYAQRGGSRVLNPSAPFVRTFSEKWMLSLNVS